MSARTHYWLRLDVEVPADTLPQAIERFMRLFRGRVRRDMRVGASYCGSYRGTFMSLRELKTAPEGRVSLAVAKKKHQLRRRRRKGAKR